MVRRAGANGPALRLIRNIGSASGLSKASAKASFAPLFHFSSFFLYDSASIPYSPVNLTHSCTSCLPSTSSPGSGSSRPGCGSACRLLSSLDVASCDTLVMLALQWTLRYSAVRAQFDPASPRRRSNGVGGKSYFGFRSYSSRTADTMHVPTDFC